MCAASQSRRSTEENLERSDVVQQRLGRDAGAAAAGPPRRQNTLASLGYVTYLTLMDLTTVGRPFYLNHACAPNHSRTAFAHCSWWALFAASPCHHTATAIEYYLAALHIGIFARPHSPIPLIACTSRQRPFSHGYL